MAFIPATNLVAKVAIEYELFGESIVNTMWFEKTDEVEWDVTSLNGLLLGVQSWTTLNLMQNLSDDLILSRLYATKQDQAVSVWAELVDGESTGQIAGDSMPSATCLSIKFATNLMGRNYRGRNFISGIPTTVVTGNQVTAAFKNSVVAAFEAIATEIEATNDCNHVVVSHYLNNAPRTTAVTVPVSTYVAVNRDLDTQRNRGGGRGA